MIYFVWDHFNGERDDAKRIEAVDFKAAAIAYAEGDHDGWTDGLYGDCSQPIVVERTTDGVQLTYEVQAEMRPHFRAWRADTP